MAGSYPSGPDGLLPGGDPDAVLHADARVHHHRLALADALQDLRFEVGSVAQGDAAQPGAPGLLDAATLALHYSKMRTATAADVSYCRRKFVSKPRGAKPGLVQVQREKVIRLRREPDRLTRLLMSTE